MTAPYFRSTASFTLRQRQVAPAIDRATFVIFSLGGLRFAAPVEAVERVLRDIPACDLVSRESYVAHGGRQVKSVDVRRSLGVSAAPDNNTTHRTIIFAVQGVWVAVVVDAVYEVATIDTATVRALSGEVSAPWASLSADNAWPTGARGLFNRHGHDVLVLDMVRVMRAVFATSQMAQDLTLEMSAALIA